jgi:hypothetical protein
MATVAFDLLPTHGDSVRDETSDTLLKRVSRVWVCVGEHNLCCAFIHLNDNSGIELD